MVASGAFTGPVKSARAPLVRIIAGMILLLTALALGLGDSVQSADDGRKTMADVPLAQPDELYTLGLGDYRGAMTTAGAGDEGLSSQDRFEIARLFRLSSAARRSRQTSDAAYPANPATAIRGR
jgi:hypothetical protein